MTTTVFVRDVANNRVHRRYRIEGRHGLYSNESEHDSSGAFRVLTDAEMLNVSEEDLCRRDCCFPEVEGVPV